MLDNQPKILFISYSDQAGGAAKAAYRIHKAVQSLGVESTMFVMNKQTEDPSVIALKDFLPHNALYKSFYWIRYKVANKLQHARWSKYPNRHKEYFMSDLRHDDIKRAFHKMNINEYDVIHLHWINHRFFDLSVLKDFKKPIVWTLHDSWPLCGVCHYFLDCEKYKTHCSNCPFLHSNKEKDLSYQIFEKKLLIYQNLDLHIVTPSRWLGDYAKSSKLFDEFTISVIPNCLDTDVFCPEDAMKFLTTPKKILEKRLKKTFVLYGAVNAATDKIKGFSNLLSAIQILEKQGKTNFELVVFGAKNEDLPSSIRDLKIQVRNVGFVNRTEALVNLYRSASVMVVPSLTENLSCAIMESMSCGTPVVAFNIGGNGDMVEHHVNGYLAVEQDNEDLAHGILWCLEYNNNNNLGKNARKKVMENYSLQKVAKQYAELYASIIKK